MSEQAMAVPVAVEGVEPSVATTWVSGLSFTPKRRW